MSEPTGSVPTSSVYTLKQRFLDIAEVTDALRIFPRLVIGYYGYWIAFVIDGMLKWYFGLLPEARSAEVTAVFGIVIPGVLGLAVWLYKLYGAGGRNWHPDQPDQPNPG
jgi:hypothetical protein